MRFLTRDDLGKLVKDTESEDFLHEIQNNIKFRELHLRDAQFKNYALTEIENTVQRSGITLKQISGNASMVCRNVQQVGRRDELWSRSIKAGIVQLNHRWNDEQKQIYYVVIESVEKQN